MGIFDAFKKKSKEEKEKERMEKIRESGKFGEKQFEYDNALFELKRTPYGKDYEKPVTDRNGRRRTESWEVKMNNSPLSKKQKKTKGLWVRRYVMTPHGYERSTEDRSGNLYEPVTFTKNRITKYKKVKKSKGHVILDSLLGSGSSRSRKKSGSSNVRFF